LFRSLPLLWLLSAAALLPSCASAPAPRAAPADTAAAPRWLEVNDISLRYQLIGAGPHTLVLLHEMQMSMESWDELLPALTPGHRILRYDLRGFGLSEKVRGSTLSIDDEVQDLRALLDALDIREPVTLIGGAVGGAIALKFAATYPQRVLAVAVTSPAAYMQAQPERAASAAALEHQSLRSGFDQTLDAVYPASLRTPARLARFRGLVLANDPGSLAATTHMIYSVGFADVLPKVQCAALVVATALFPRPVASFKELADAMPKGRFVVLQTGHFASLESPELVAPVLQQFLTDVGG
jgi:pimeloyl-ACP methyl ester carboxylesterase